MRSYDPKQKSKHIVHLDANHLHGYATSKLLPTSGFKPTDPNDYVLNKYHSNSSKDCELHTYFPLALDKVKIKREMLPKYQLILIMINADFYKIPIANVKNSIPNFFVKKNMCFIMNACSFI